MATRTTELGTLASEAIEELFTGVGAREAGRSDALWAALVESEWPSAAHAESEPDETLDLRAIQEIARATGRHPSVTPIVSTMLAAAWSRDVELEPDRPILVAFPRDGGSVLLDAVDGALVIGADGLAEAPEPATRERFAPTSETFGYGADTLAPLDGERLAHARAAAAAIAVGCADAAIEKAAAWAATRQQFGQPIARFQAVRHHLADMHMAREQAWTAAIVAGIETDASARWASLAARLARRAIELAIQVHGGVGFTVEVGLHVYLDRVLEIESIAGATR